VLLWPRQILRNGGPPPPLELPASREDRAGLARQLRAEGLLYREIAARLGCTPDWARKLALSGAVRA
jgi:hypothetical protein